MITFRKENNLLILSYSPERSEWIYDKFNNNQLIVLKKTFYFNNEDKIKGNETENEFDEFNTFEFKLGNLVNHYYLIDKRILNIDYDVYLPEDLDIRQEHFISHNNISIFKKFAKILKQDIYIGGEQVDSLPTEEFNKLVKSFPNSYEIDKYVKARLSAILRNYFENTSDSVKEYECYMNKKVSLIGTSLKRILKDSELNKYILIKEKLVNMLNDEIKYNEKQWQKEILEIILLLFPKYILVFEEVIIKDTYNNKDRRLDYLLVDSGGNIDIIEIKKPMDNCIITKSQYRDNFIPMRELSGTVMQIEKYIFYLNKWGQNGETHLNNCYKNLIPNDFKIRITNPSGIIIMGREKGLSTEQLQDFEIVKRKYKNVVDIITYDDLLNRLGCIINQLKMN